MAKRRSASGLASGPRTKATRVILWWRKRWASTLRIPTSLSMQTLEIPSTSRAMLHMGSGRKRSQYALMRSAPIRLPMLPARMTSASTFSGEIGSKTRSRRPSAPTMPPAKQRRLAPQSRAASRAPPRMDPW